MEEKKMIDASSVIDKIIAVTLTRHAKLTEEEFLKTLKIENPKSESEEVRNSEFALISAITREILALQDKVKRIDATMKLVFDVKGE